MVITLFTPTFPKYANIGNPNFQPGKRRSSDQGDRPAPSAKILGEKPRLRGFIFEFTKMLTLEFVEVNSKNEKKGPKIRSFEKNIGRIGLSLESPKRLGLKGEAATKSRRNWFLRN
jgi:hypothetical protein